MLTQFATAREAALNFQPSGKSVLFALGLTLGMASTSQAYDFNYMEAVGSQENFALLSKDLSAALSFRPMEPAADLGLLGFDLGATATVTQLNSVEVLKRATGSSSVPSNLPTIGVRASKGLPLGFDVGVSYNGIGGTSVTALSGSLKWTFISGGVLTPAFSVRGFYTQVDGISRMGLRSRGVDVSVSKGFAMVTPYVGVGLVNSTATTTDHTWAKESFYQARVFAGVNANLLLVNLAGEVDMTGDDTSYSLKMGLNF